MATLNDIKFYQVFKMPKRKEKQKPIRGRDWGETKSTVFIEKVNRIKATAEKINKKLLKTA